MTLNTKNGKERLKTKNQRCKNTKKQNTGKRKPSFTKRIGRKCKLRLTHAEQNNDHSRIMHKTEFRSAFKLE